VPAPPADEPLEIDLKNPGWAAFWAWLWPGAGHLYQGRTAKGMLFMVCILGTFLYGLYLGQGRVVYFGEQDAARAGGGGWRRLISRLPYVCQVCAGAPALPALVRARTGGNPQQDLFHWTNWYVPPRELGELDDIHRRLHRNFELGTVFTMIAGLLNVLAIYDAWGGPAYASEKKDEEAAKTDQTVAV
jgi:hypothetical protein